MYDERTMLNAAQRGQLLEGLCRRFDDLERRILTLEDQIGRLLTIIEMALSEEDDEDEWE